MSNPMSPISPTSPYPAIPSIVVPERSPANSQPPRMQRGQLSRLDCSLLPGLTAASPSDLGHHGALSARSFQDSSPGGTGKPLSAISTNSQTYPPSPVYATPPTSPLPPAPPASSRILFYDKDRPYYGFTNFSAHPVVYEGRTYPTSEHLFQSFKVRNKHARPRIAYTSPQFHGHRPGLAMHIQTCGPSARTAFQEARNFQPEARKDWFRVNLAKVRETCTFQIRCLFSVRWTRPYG